MTDAWPGTLVSGGEEETSAPDAGGYPGQPADNGTQDFSAIDNDPSLSPETKEQLKQALRDNPGASGYLDEQGRPVVNINGGQPEQPASDVQPSDDILKALGRGTRDVMNVAGGAADLVTLPVTAIMRLLGADIRPYKDLTNEAADKIGLPRSETGGQQFISALNEGAGLGALTAGAGGALAGAGGVTGAVGETLAATPVADVVSGATGSGAADLTRQAGYGPIAQFAASLLGGGIGAGAAMAPRGIAGLLPKNRTPTGLAQAAGDLGIDLLPADAGGATTRRLSAGAVQAPVSAAPIVQAGQKILAQSQKARDQVADMFGGAGTVEATGEAARRGALEYIKNSGKQGGRLYDRAGKLAADTRVELPKAIETVDAQIARLKENPIGDNGVAELEDLKAALQRPGGFSVQGVRDMRTEMFVAPELRGSPAEARIKQVVDAAAQDIEDGLRAQGKGDAADAFKVADENWKTRLDTIDNVIRPIIGKDATAKGSEDIFKQIDNAAKGNAGRLHRFVNALPEEDANLVRATLIGRLGLARNGAQNAAGDAFSLDTFLTNWNELSPGAKALFGAEARGALDKLAIVADASKNAGRYANHSNSAGGILAQTLLSGGSGLLGFKTLGATLAGQYGAGRLLASPRFARWLASAPKKPNGPATLAHIHRLSAIAAAEPNIQNEVLRLQQTLQARMGGASSGMPVAAQPEGNEQ